MDLNKIKQKKSIFELLNFGIINIDKPSGPTSFNVSDFIRKKLGLKKTSHFGTLDPKVTGVLPIALNRACKLTGYFLGEYKEYVGIMRFHDDVSTEKINDIIKRKFIGTILQKPPVKSRVKRQERQRTIYNFKIFEKDGKDFLFSTKVQGGTYIRKLIDDLGKELGVGAHMLELRRVQAGIFSETNSINLYDFDKAVNEYKNGNKEILYNMITPAEIISEVYPILKIKKDNLKQILTGKPIFRKDLIKDKGWKKDSIVCAFLDDRFIGMYQIFRGKEIFAKPRFVMNNFFDKKNNFYNKNIKPSG